jgi:hypothetical protein
VTVLFGLSWIDRVASPRKGAWLLWIAPARMGVQTEFDPNSLIASARKWLMIIIWPVYMFSGFAPLFAMGHWVFPVTFGIIMLAVMMIVERSVRKHAVPASGIQPGLFGWNDLASIQLREKQGGRFQLRATRNSWIAPGNVVDVTLEMSEAGAKQLTSQIEELSGKKVTS